MLIDEGYQINYRTFMVYWKKENEIYKEAYIRQSYKLGQRLEYDFGEVKLMIDGKRIKYYLAVLCAPASGFRWAYLYTNQKKEVFLDSHVKFFEMVKGSYQSVVYDNMRNVVSKFIGKNEKQLNKDLIQLALYYGFEINVTNCFSGNEKRSVEGSVKFIRNKAFTKQYKFSSYEKAQEHLYEALKEINNP